MEEKNVKRQIDRRVSVAPMMGWTDRHDRYFLRLIAPNIPLYTVMLTTGALIHGKSDSMLKFHKKESPLALQLGGSDPKDLSICAKYGEEEGYDEINLNCGCPSDRVQRGDFGACLMKNASLVADSIDAMKQTVDIPVTVKCRIGVDEFDSYEFLTEFIRTIAERDCDAFIVHARKAWLNGLSPKDNRTVPPLRWDIVQNLKNDFPDLTIVLNGGIETLEQTQESLEWADGVMIGREAYHNPYLLSSIEQNIYNTKELRSRHQVIDDIMPYIEDELKKGTKLKDITRHMLGLFQGIKGAKHWRRTISENAWKTDNAHELFEKATEKIELD